MTHVGGGTEELNINSFVNMQYNIVVAVLQVFSSIANSLAKDHFVNLYEVYVYTHPF